MLKYIVRLDDATPKMNKDNWEKIEIILDKYNVKPIVGVIPDCLDTLFTWDEDKLFWSETISRWKKKIGQLLNMDIITFTMNIELAKNQNILD